MIYCRFIVFHECGCIALENPTCCDSPSPLLSRSPNFRGINICRRGAASTTWDRSLNNTKLGEPPFTSRGLTELVRLCCYQSECGILSTIFNHAMNTEGAAATLVVCDIFLSGVIIEKRLLLMGKKGSDYKHRFCLRILKHFRLQIFGFTKFWPPLFSRCNTCFFSAIQLAANFAWVLTMPLSLETLNEIGP